MNEFVKQVVIQCLDNSGYSDMEFTVTDAIQDADDIWRVLINFNIDGEETGGTIYVNLDDMSAEF